MDNETCPALMGTPGDGEQSACVYPYSHSAIGVTTGTGVATYRSTNFNRMVMQRPLWVRWLLEHGYNVIQCDLDIVWLNDPQPALRAAKVQITKGGAVIRAMLPGVKSAKDDYANGAMYRAYGNGNVNSNEMSEAAPDLLFQSEQAYGLNGGFYFARPTKATLAFFNAWVERLTVMITMPSFEEQHALNSAILRMRRNNSADMRLLHSHLPSRAFPNGKIWWTYPVCAVCVCMRVHASCSLCSLYCAFFSRLVAARGRQARRLPRPLELEQTAEEEPHGERSSLVPHERRQAMHGRLRPDGLIVPQIMRAGHVFSARLDDDAHEDLRQPQQGGRLSGEEARR